MDVDILVTTESNANERTNIMGMLEKIVSNLEKNGFLKERLGALRYSSSGS